MGRSPYGLQAAWPEAGATAASLARPQGSPDPQLSSQNRLFAGLFNLKTKVPTIGSTFECPPQTRQSGSHPGDPRGGAGRSPPLQRSGYCRADPSLWPLPAPRDAHALREDRRLGRVHLLLQLVLVALPGQLVLVLGPLGRERAVCTRPGHRSHGPRWDSAGAGPKERPACPTPAALRPGAAASPHSESSSAPRPAPGPARPSAAPRRPRTPARHTSRPEPRARPGLPP